MTRVHVVDPSAYTPPYDAALCQALSRQGAEVELITSAFAYGEAPGVQGYAVRELFYRHSMGPPGSRRRRLTKLAEHVPDMARYRAVARAVDVVHFQWLVVQWLDRHLLPRRPLVLTAHDLLPREPRPGQMRAQRRLYEVVDAVITHSDYGRGQLVEHLGVPEEKVTVVHHGAFDYLTALPEGSPPPELGSVEGPVVLFFGLLRPYKGIEVLLEAWRRLSAGGEHSEAELWIAGRPRIPLEPLRRSAGPGVRFVPRFVSELEMAACFRRADVVVLPYVETERLDFSGVLATALAFGKPIVVSDVGGFGEVAAAGAARLVPPGDADALAAELSRLLHDQAARGALAAAALAAAAGPYSWEKAARRTLEVYRQVGAA